MPAKKHHFTYANVPFQLFQVILRENIAHQPHAFLEMVSTVICSQTGHNTCTFLAPGRLFNTKCEHVQLLYSNVSNLSISPQRTVSKNTCRLIVLEREREIYNNRCMFSKHKKATVTCRHCENIFVEKLQAVHTCVVVPPDRGRWYGPHPAEWATLPGPHTQTPHRPP